MSAGLFDDRDNRAASAFFRVFGGRLARPPGDEVVMARFSGSHLLEKRVLALLVPLVLGVAVFDGLFRIGGAWAAAIGVVPCSILGLHFLSFVLGAWSPRVSFYLWGSVLLAWAVAVRSWGPGGVVIHASTLWIAIAAMEGVGLLGLLWRWLMSVAGTAGVAVRIGVAVVAHLAIVALWWRFGAVWGLAAGAVTGGVWALGTFLPCSGIFGPVATRSAGRGVLLTIDDGPDPEDTPVILDLLDRHGAKAVFFVIGDKVRQFPELAREIVARGHEIANHTMTHPQGGMWCAGPGRTRREILDGSRAIEEVTGVKPRWFRAPVGHRNYFTHPVTLRAGLEVVAWTRRGFDTTGRDVDRIVADLTRNLRDGDVLLLHESTPVAREVIGRVLEVVGGRISPLPPRDGASPSR